VVIEKGKLEPNMKVKISPKEKAKTPPKTKKIDLEEELEKMKLEEDEKITYPAALGGLLDIIKELYWEKQGEMQMRDAMTRLPDTKEKALWEYIKGKDMTDEFKEAEEILDKYRSGVHPKNAEYTSKMEKVIHTLLLASTAIHFLKSTGQE
jgi:hypothetical protein